MKDNLVVICGKENLEAKSFLETYFSDKNYDCDFIVVNEQNVKNDCSSNILYAYKCLDFANHIKNKTERDNDLIYKTCFFIDSGNFKNIKLPKNILNPIENTIHTSEIEIIKSIFEVGLSTKAKQGNRVMNEPRYNIKLIPTWFWYSKSIEFNVISKYFNFFTSENRLNSVLLKKIDREDEWSISKKYKLSFHSYIRIINYGVML